MWSSAEVLVYLLLCSAVLLTAKLVIAGVYPLAAGLVISLVGYGYLVRWGGHSIEERLLSPPRRP